VTTPARARESLAGTIFEGTVEPDQYESLRRRRSVTQSYLVEGRNRVRVYEPGGSPPEGFAAVAPTLEDAYLVLIRDRSPSLAADEGLAEAAGVGVAR
jgi:hypothetical protein